MARTNLTDQVTELRAELRQMETRIQQMSGPLSHTPGHERGLRRLSAKIRTTESALNELIRRESANRETANAALQAAWQEELDRLRTEIEGFTTDFNTQLIGIRAQVTAQGDQLGRLANDRVFEIDFDESRHVPVRGRVDVNVDWLISVVVGIVAGIVFGILASNFAYDWFEGWSLSRSIAAGTIIGLAVFCFWAAFERFSFVGVGQITWAERPTMQDEADIMRLQDDLRVDLFAQNPPTSRVEVQS